MTAVAKIEQHNPIGTDGFEFVEFTAPTAEGIEQLRQLFTAMGFTETAKHRSKEVWLFQQNDINIVLNGSPTGHVRAFGEKHGPSACAMAFRVKNAAQAAAYVEQQGAKLVGSHANFGELNIPCVEGIGGSLLYLVDRYSNESGDKTIYDVDFEYIEGRSPNDNAVGLQCIDHLTHNVHKGNMDTWFDFYGRLFNFRQIRFFDIEGRASGLFSRALTSPDGKIRIVVSDANPGVTNWCETLDHRRGYLQFRWQRVSRELTAESCTRVAPPCLTALAIALSTASRRPTGRPTMITVGAGTSETSRSG